VAFDVDGVLTDGRLVLGSGGDEYKVFHSRDGQGFVMLREAAIQVAVISGRSSPVVAERMAQLGIEFVYQGCNDKLAVFAALLDRLGIGPERAAHVGDDLPDLAVMGRVGLAIAVADAHPEVRRRAHWCTRLPGGRGAAREVCDLLLESRGLLEPLTRRYAGEPP
jgi:3-deoxy-D-manno-octulosonate 8-phosphate phosphatase (KDO 8-P phosphatase)